MEVTVTKCKAIVPIQGHEAVQIGVTLYLNHYTLHRLSQL